MKLELREAVAADADLLLSWRNDAETRRQSFSTDPVASDDHQRWFAAKLAARHSTRIWILMCDGQPAGQVRYDRQPDGAGDVSIGLAPAFRGRGLSVELLRRSAPRACRELTLREIRAFVKPSNAASIAAFARAGFGRVADETMAEGPRAVFLWTCRKDG